jgi:hypothetical protein
VAEGIVGREKMMSRLVVIILLIFAFAFSVHSQDKKTNVVYLKNGRIVAGRIIEIIPDQLLKIVTAENIVITIAYADISYVGNERMEYYSETTDSTLYALGITYSLFAGLAFPADEFGNTNHPSAGYAKTGSIVGAEVNFPLVRSLYINASIAMVKNAVDEQSFRLNGLPNTITSRIESWTSFWVMPGLRSETKFEHVTMFASLNYGWTLVQSPVIFLSGNFSALTSPSNANSQPGYAVTIGGTAFDHFTFALKYFHTKPSLPVTVMSNPELLDPLIAHPALPSSSFFEQPVSIYSVIIGFSF